MDENKRRLFEMEVRFIEQKYGVHLVPVPSRKDKLDAVTDIRMGRESKATLIHHPVNELPF